MAAARLCSPRLTKRAALPEHRRIVTVLVKRIAALFPYVLFVLLAVITACASGPRLENETVTNARVAGTVAPLTFGDCVAARQRAAEKPDLTVDRLPSPVSMKPPALRRVPASAYRTDGSAEVKVDVIVDTLGRAVMSSFHVISVSNPWFATNVKSVIGKWRFSPAELAGCKVPRVYHFMASAPARGRAKSTK
jgi:hypothetical protein